MTLARSDKPSSYKLVKLSQQKYNTSAVNLGLHQFRVPVKRKQQRAQYTSYMVESDAFTSVPMPDPEYHE